MTSQFVITWGIYSKGHEGFMFYCLYLLREFKTHSETTDFSLLSIFICHIYPLNSQINMHVARFIIKVLVMPTL